MDITNAPVFVTLNDSAFDSSLRKRVTNALLSQFFADVKAKKAARRIGAAVCDDDRTVPRCVVWAEVVL